MVIKIKKITTKKRLFSKILFFLGPLFPNQMCLRYRKTHEDIIPFITPSSKHLIDLTTFM